MLGKTRKRLEKAAGMLYFIFITHRDSSCAQGIKSVAKRACMVHHGLPRLMWEQSHQGRVDGSFKSHRLFLCFDAGKLDLFTIPQYIICVGPLEIDLVREALNPLVSVGCADVPVPHPVAAALQSIMPRKGQANGRH